MLSDSTQKLGIVLWRSNPKTLLTGNKIDSPSINHYKVTQKLLLG